jgi:hypothetical protein
MGHQNDGEIDGTVIPVRATVAVVGLVMEMQRSWGDLK